MYSYSFPKLDKWKYTNLETTVFYKALGVTPVPEIVVIITRFSGKNSSKFSLRAVTYVSNKILFNFPAIFLKVVRFLKIQIYVRHVSLIL